MKRLVILFLLLLNSSSFFCQGTKNKKILIVATNVDTLAGKPNGTYLIEIFYPFKYFTDQGYDLDIVTPKGGKTALYGDIKEEMKSVRESNLFVSKTNNSLSPAEVKYKEYAAVYYPGGYGQFFDVVNCENIHALTAKIHKNGGIVAAAGHGAASLVNIKLSNSKYFVEGRRLTCFPTWMETSVMSVSNYGKTLPFNMEELLRKRGSEFVACQKVSVGPCIVIDSVNRLITGAYADNALRVAEETVKLMQSDPKKKN